MKPERRLRSETVSIDLDAGPDPAGAPAIHRFDVSLAYGENGILREVVFVGRGKVGHGIDLLFHDLGIKLSRAIQGRDPNIETLQSES